MPSYTHKPKNNIKGLARQTGTDLDNIFDRDEFVIQNRRKKRKDDNISDPAKPGDLPGLDPNLFDTPWYNKEDDNVVISGNEEGNGNKIAKTLNDKKDYGKDSISGTKRFNYLQKLYFKVKDIPGVENNPKFHKLVKKLSRKYPRMIAKLERAKKSSQKVRQQTADELSTNPGVAPIKEIETSAINAWNKFGIMPWSPKDYNVKENSNNEEEIGVDEQIIQKYSAGENLGPRLGTNPNLGSDISAALKNKKW